MRTLYPGDATYSDITYHSVGVLRFLYERMRLDYFVIANTHKLFQLLLLLRYGLLDCFFERLQSIQLRYELNGSREPLSTIA